MRLLPRPYPCCFHAGAGGVFFLCRVVRRLIGELLSPRGTVRYSRLYEKLH